MRQKFLSVVLCLAVCLLLVPSAFCDEQKLTLEECLTLAAKNNSSIKETLSEKDVKNFQWKLSRVPMYPRLSLSASTSKTGNGTEVNSFSRGLSLSQLVYDSGKTQAQITQTKLSLNIQDEKINELLLEIRFQVKQKFYEDARAAEKLKFADVLLEKADMHLKSAQKKLDAGLGVKTDVLKAEVDVARAKLTILQVENDKKKALVELSALLGKNVEDIAYEPLLPNPVSLDTDALKKSVGTSHPSLKKIKLQIETERFSYKEAATEKKPSFSFSGDTSYTDRAGKYSQSWSISLSGKLLLYEGNEVSLKKKRSLAVQNQLQNAYKGKKIDLLEQLEKTILDVQKVYSEFEVTRQSAAVSEENLQLAEGRYDAGVGSILELTDAQEALAQSRLQLIDSAANYFILLAQLERITGKDFIGK